MMRTTGGCASPFLRQRRSLTSGIVVAKTSFSFFSSRSRDASLKLSQPELPLPPAGWHLFCFLPELLLDAFGGLLPYDAGEQRDVCLLQVADVLQAGAVESSCADTADAFEAQQGQERPPGAVTVADAPAVEAP